MLRTVLSPLLVVIAVLLIPSIGSALFFLPLILALSVSIVNFRKLKINNKYFGVFLTVVQSYAVFLGLAVSLFVLDALLEDVILVNDNESGLIGIILVTVGGYLAAMLLFYFLMFVFNVDNKRFAFLSITIWYTMIVIVMQVFSKNEYLQFGVEKFASFLISWIIFMSLAYSMALNRAELMQFLKKW